MWVSHEDAGGLHDGEFVCGCHMKTQVTFIKVPTRATTQGKQVKSKSRQDGTQGIITFLEKHIENTENLKI